MSYHVSMEQVEGHWVAFIPALLGCFASAKTQDSAIAALPAALQSYADWRQLNGDPISVTGSPTFEVDEIVREWPDPADPDDTVSAFFAADASTLAADDISQGLRLLGWTYADLLQAGRVPDDAMVTPVEDGWTIEGILSHCSRAEWWYLDRLGLAPDRSTEPARWQGRLALAHARLLTVLPQLEGVARIELKKAEVWSPRKLLRRAVWHERDHTQHIYQFRDRLGV